MEILLKVVALFDVAVLVMASIRAWSNRHVDWNLHHE